MATTLRNTVPLAVFVSLLFEGAALSLQKQWAPFGSSILRPMPGIPYADSVSDKRAAFGYERNIGRAAKLRRLNQTELNQVVMDGSCNRSCGFSERYIFYLLKTNNPAPVL